MGDWAARDAFARRQLRARRRLTQLLAFYRANPCRMARTQLLAACAITLGRFCGHSRRLRRHRPGPDAGRRRGTAPDGGLGRVRGGLRGGPTLGRPRGALALGLHAGHPRGVCRGPGRGVLLRGRRARYRPDLAPAAQAHGGDRRGAGDRFLGPGGRGGIRDSDGQDHGARREPTLHGRVVAPCLLRGGGGPGDPHSPAAVRPGPFSVTDGLRWGCSGTRRPRGRPRGYTAAASASATGAAEPPTRGGRCWPTSSGSASGRSTRSWSAFTRTRPPST